MSVTYLPLSSLKETDEMTPELSWAFAWTLMRPLTVEPLVGFMMLTVGGVMSIEELSTVNVTVLGLDTLPKVSWAMAVIV